MARGGAGAVYEAEDRELGRKVALKVYHHIERDRGQLAHEARVAAALAGPGVVRVLDADPAHGWLALEWAPLGAIRDHVRAMAKNSERVNTFSIGFAWEGDELDAALDELTPREREVIRLRYGLDGNEPRTLEEVGRTLEVTRERVRQIESSALVKLRKRGKSRRLRELMS